MKHLEEEINKLKYQMSILVSTIDSDKYPVESLILSLNWNDDDLNAAHDIFEKYDKKLEAKEKEINWSAFEHELRDRFNIGYQTVKSIILAFYKNHQWVEVCYQYAKAFTCLEFHSLIRDYEQHI
jgi:hypothetical protein